MNPTFENAVKRGDNTIFADITLENQVAQTDANGDPLKDSHGNIKWATKTQVSIPGEVVVRGTAKFNQRVSGIEEDIDALVWISDDSVTFTSGEDDEATRATRVLVDGYRYIVRNVFDERNGRRRATTVIE